MARVSAMPAPFEAEYAARSTTAARAPALANRIAAARPLPMPSPAAPPPVTMATLPSSPQSSGTSSRDSTSGYGSRSATAIGLDGSARGTTTAGGIRVSTDRYRHPDGADGSGRG